MSCASAIDSYENEAFDEDKVNAELDDASFLLAETQDESVSTAYAEIKLMENEEDVIDDIISHSMDTSMDHEHLLEYDTDITEEAVNLLLPEMEPTAGLDCTNFVDFDEFNLCLTNILSENDDVELSTDDFIGVNINAGHPNQSTIKTSNSWNKLMSQNTQIDDILNVVQIGDDSDEYDNNSSGIKVNKQHSQEYPIKNFGTCKKVNTFPKADTEKQEKQVQEQEIDAAGSTSLDVINMNSHGIVNLFQ